MSNIILPHWLPPSEVIIGEPSGARTRDPVIKSHVLFQLSYWLICDLFSRECSTLTKELFDYLGILLASAGLKKSDADVDCVDSLFVSHSKYFPFIFNYGACQWSRTTTLRFFRPVLQTASKLDRHMYGRGCGTRTHTHKTYGPKPYASSIPPIPVVAGTVFMTH